MPGSSKRSISLRFPHLNPVCTSPIYLLKPHPSYSSWSDHANSTCEQYRSFSSSLYSSLHSTVTSSLLGPNILLSTLFWNTLSKSSSFNVRDQFSYPYKTIDKITFLCVLIFIILDSKLEDNRFFTERQAFPEFNVVWLSCWIEFWFV